MESGFAYQLSQPQMLIQGIVNACAQVCIDFMNNKAYDRVQQLNFCHWNYARMFLHPHTDFLLEILGLCFSLRENLQSMPEWHTQSLTYWGNVLYDILSMLESFNKIISMCLIHPKLGSHVKNMKSGELGWSTTIKWPQVGVSTTSRDFRVVHDGVPDYSLIHI